MHSNKPVTRTTTPTPQPNNKKQNKYSHFFFFASLKLNTNKSSSSTLYSASVFAFVSIFPLYDNIILDSGTLLPIVRTRWSRRVDTKCVTGMSCRVTTLPSSFHSGFVLSTGSWIWTEMGCCR